MERKGNLNPQKENLHITAVLWCLLSSLCLTAMLITASHKTIVIADASKEHGGTVNGSEEAVEGEKIASLQLLGDSYDGKLRLPLEKGMKAENVVMENHYMDKELWIYIREGDASFYSGNAVCGDTAFVKSGWLESQENGLILKLQMTEVFEYHSVLEDTTLTIQYKNPRELYKHIVVIDPVGGGEETGELYNGCMEKDIALQVALRLPREIGQSEIKLYFTRTEDVSVSDAERLELAKAVQADFYVRIGASTEKENAECYGIQSLYNEEYFIPDFGNVELGDSLTRQVTIASGNRARGLERADKASILKKLKIPAAQINLGYLTNEKERTLMQRESYQDKLAKGIEAAIMEVYTKYYEK